MTLASNVLLLTQSGISEQEVLDLPLDKFETYTKAAENREKQLRQLYVMDTASAVGGLFSSKDMKNYLKQIDNPDEVNGHQQE